LRGSSVRKSLGSHAARESVGSNPTPATTTSRLYDALGNEVNGNPRCPECGSSNCERNGHRYLKDGADIQRWSCKDCAYRFSEPLQKKFKQSLKTRGAILTNRQICVSETKNLDTTAISKIAAGDAKEKGLLLQFAFYLNKEGKAEHTIRTYTSCLKRIARHADLDDPESVKEYLAKIKKSVNTKANYCVAYTAFLTWQGKTWRPPKYTARSPIPEFIPTEEEIDQLVAGCGKKTATILRAIKETGMRIGECLSITWTALNDKANTLTLNTPEKHSLPRIFKVTPKLVMMLQALPKKHERMFGVTTAKDAQRCLARSRKRIAAKVGNSRLAKIHFHLIRHWKGTMEYHKTHDPDHVRRLLGHRSLLPTQIYINMEQVLFSGNADEYHVKAISSVEEATALIEVGFEYVTDIDGKKLFRKRK
jgi:integrase